MHGLSQKGQKQSSLCHVVPRDVGIRIGSLRGSLVLSAVLPTAAFPGKTPVQCLAGPQQSPVHIPPSEATPADKEPSSPNSSSRRPGVMSHCTGAAGAHP